MSAREKGANIQRLHFHTQPMQKQKRHYDVIMDRLDIMPPQAPYTSMHFDRQSDQNLHYLNIFACF